MKLLTTAQVAKRLKCSRAAVLHRIKSKHQKAVKNQFGLWMIRDDEITKPLPMGRPRKVKK